MSGTNDRIDQMLDFIGRLVRERDELRLELARLRAEIAGLEVVEDH